MLGALLECSPTAAGKIGIAIDVGIHRTSTVFKAIGLSAQHCFVGSVPALGLGEVSMPSPLLPPYLGMEVAAVLLQHNGEEEVNLTTRQPIKSLVTK